MAGNTVSKKSGFIGNSILSRIPLLKNAASCTTSVFFKWKKPSHSSAYGSNSRLSTEAFG